jgi:DNA repair photolyase
MGGDKLTVVYEPKGAAWEYGKLALNIYKGCVHNCIYCYNNGRFGEKGDFFAGAKPRNGITAKLVADCRYLADKFGDDCPEILLTFLGDAYQPAEAVLGLTRMAIRTLISFNLPFTILTKSALINRDIDNPRWW